MNEKEKESISPEEKSSRIWPISFGEKGEILGLPEGVTREQVLLYIDEKGKWWATNPSSEIIEEIKKWRSDWMDVE